MKKLITLITMILAAGMVMAQPALKVDQNGRVGIGTATPNATLHVKGSGAAFEPADGNTTINFQGLNPQNRFQFQSFINTTESWSYFSLFGDDVNQGRKGEVGFFGQYLRFFNGVTGGDGGGSNPFGTESMRLTLDGKLGVGFTSVPSQHKMAVNGSIQATAFVEASDRKLKSNIREYNYGLEEVMRMKPKFYNYKSDIMEDSELKIGVIAQEFEKIIPEAVYEVDYKKHNLANEVIEEGKYKVVNTAAVRYTLINAIQEQQAIIESLQEANENLLREIESIKQSLAVKTIESDISNGSSAILKQNAPNPFNGSTTFEYEVPQGFKKASVLITNMSGQLIKTIDITEAGAGLIRLNSEELSQGNYLYTLRVDGKNTDTLKMLKVN